MIIFLIGPSACGKGTQADLLSKKYNIPHESMGEILRNEIAKGTEKGIRLKGILDAGLFAPAELTNPLLIEAMKRGIDKNGGVIVDGFPRIMEQATFLEPFLEEKAIKYRVIHYLLSLEECKKRQQNRIKQGIKRNDDDVLEMRYKEYMKEIDLICDYYRKINVLFEVNANDTIENIFNKTLEYLENE